MPFFRFRNTFLYGGSLVVLLLLASIDPDTGWISQLPFGVSAVMAVVSLSKFILALALVNIGRHSLHDYPEASARQHFRKVLEEDSVASGLALVSLALISTGLMFLFGKAFGG